MLAPSPHAGTILVDRLQIHHPQNAVPQAQPGGQQQQHQHQQNQHPHASNSGSSAKHCGEIYFLCGLVASSDGLVYHAQPARAAAFLQTMVTCAGQELQHLRRPSLRSAGSAASQPKDTTLQLYLDCLRHHAAALDQPDHVEFDHMILASLVGLILCDAAVQKKAAGPALFQNLRRRRSKTLHFYQNLTPLHLFFPPSVPGFRRPAVRLA